MGKRRDQLNAFRVGMKKTRQVLPDQVAGFSALHKAMIKPGVLDVKTKELIGVAISCYNRCEYCIVSHVYAALKYKATQEEILEAGMVAVLFGGGPSIAYLTTVLNECIEEFGPDFEEK